MKFSKYNLLLPSKKKGNYYLFNTFNGSCYEVDNNIANIVKNNSINDLKEDVKELFSLSGVIIADEINEDNVLSYMQGLTKYNNMHYTSTVLLTWDCNLRCTYCIIDFGIVRTEGSACTGYSSNCFLENEIGDILYDLWNYAESQGFKHNNKPQRRYIYCGLCGDNQYSVAPNLDVYKCILHVGVKEHLMGRIDENGRFVDQTPAFYEWMSIDPLKNEECKNCVYLPSCGGGCGVVAYNETGSYHAKGCFKVKGTVEKQVLKFVEDIMKQRSSS